MFLWARIRKRSLQVKKTGCLLQADGITKEINGNPVNLLKEYYSDFEIHKDDEQLAFTGGLVGGLGYDKELMHGKQSLITQDGRGIFEGIPSPVHVARYHSLAVDEKTLPDVFEILARTEDGEIMAMQHKEYPLIGIQFHPESIYTDHGKKMIENFLKL